MDSTSPCAAWASAVAARASWRSRPQRSISQLEVPDTEVSGVRELVREEMVGAYPLDPPLAVDVGAGDNWADAK